MENLFFFSFLFNVTNMSFLFLSKVLHHTFTDGKIEKGVYLGPAGWGGGGGLRGGGVSLQSQDHCKG